MLSTINLFVIVSMLAFLSASCNAGAVKAVAKGDEARTAQAIGQAIDDLITGIRDKNPVAIVGAALGLAEAIVETAGGEIDSRTFSAIGSAVDELVKGIENDDTTDIVSGAFDLAKSITLTVMGKRGYVI